MNLRIAVAVLLLLPSAAFAQGNPGPFGGLFGRTPERIGDYTLFEFRTSTSVQLDDEVVNTTGVTHDGIGTIAGLSGSAMLDRRTSRLRARLRTAGAYHDYISPPVGATTAESNGALTWKVGTRFSLDGALTHLYSPYFQFHPALLVSGYVPGIIAPSAAYATSLIASHSVEANGGFSSQYSKHSTLSGWVWRRQTRFTHDSAHDFELNGVRGLWTRRMNRTFGLRFGYARDEIRPAALSDVTYIHESIEAGVDLTRALSLTRNTSLEVQSQSSFIRRADDRIFRLNGGVVLSHWLARTWRLGLNAGRNTDFLPGFVEPLFSDTVGVSLSGLVSTRTEFIVAVNGGRGYFGIDGGQGRLETAASNAQLNFAVTRKFGLFAQHVFYHVAMPPDASPLAVAHRVSRQSLTVGITAWFPVINRDQSERSPSDSR